MKTLSLVLLFAAVSLNAQPPVPRETPTETVRGPMRAEPEAPTKAEPGPVAEAATVRLIRFSGALRDALGQPRTGTVGVTFALYKEQSGGVPLWLETQNVELAADGRYTVLLGATLNEGLPLEIFSSEEARWLEVTVQGDPESRSFGTGEQPRILLVSVPYALKAADAERLGGKPAEAFLLAAGSGEISEKSGSGPGQAFSSGGDGTLAQVVSGTVDRIAKFTATDAVGDSEMLQVGTDIGVGTTTPIGKLHVQKTGALTKLVVGNPNPVGNNAADGFIQIFGEHNGVVKSVFIQNIGDSLQLNGAGAGVNIQLLGQSETSILNGTSLGVYNSTNAKRLYIRHDGTRVLFSTFGTGAGGMAFRPVANLTNAFEFQVAGGATTVMNIDTTNQRVGIGTVAPGAKLEVAGQVKITGGSPGAGKILTSDAAGLASWGDPGSGTGDISAVNTAAGSGLVGGVTIGAADLSLLTSCTEGKLLKRLSGAWTCADDIDTDTNSGGTVTSVGSGNGLTGGPITVSGTLSVLFGGGGAATTVARSDHAHADTFVDVTGDTMTGGLTLAAIGTATVSENFPSNFFDVFASVHNGTNPVNRHFRWQADPVGPLGDVDGSAQLSLLFALGNDPPAPTGVFIEPGGNVHATFFTGGFFVGNGALLTNLPAGEANDVNCVGCVDSTDLADLGVMTGDLANGAVTEAKLSFDPVNVAGDTMSGALIINSNLTVTGTGTLSLNTTGGGLLVEPNATSPNLIAGFSGNSVTSGALGATIGGGGRSSFTNRVTDDFGTVGGGSNNRAGNDVAPTIDAQFGTVGGGADNTASANFATVAGGRGNSAAAVKATVAGGGRSNDVDVTTGNEATDDFSTVGGGGNNQAGNGDLDTTNATFATVAGGFSNTASGVRATVGGGEVNMASSLAATIGGGAGNEASATAATVGGGTTNVASGSRATVPGGLANRAQGQFSFAAGNRAKALHDGAFVWGDSTAADVNSTATDQFTLRASGGLRMVVGATPTQVFSVAANGTVTASTVLASNASFSDDLAPGLTVVNVDNLGGGEGLKASSGGRGVLAQGGSVGVQGDGLGSGTGVQGGTDSGIAVNGISNTGIAGVFQSINPGGTILTGRNGGGLGTEVFRVSGTGNVGIGTASPDQKLTIAGGIHNTISMRGTGIPGLRLFSEDGSARDWRVETGRSAVANLDISDCSAACAPRLTINSSGRVGIGTGSPANAKLMVEASFTLARFNLTGSDGSLVDFDRDAVGIGNISVAAGIVSYNAFTGSHYGWTNQPIERGMLVTLTGQNKTLHDRPGFEPVYGITKSARANDPRILGAYLARSEPGKAEEPVTENPHLVMAVGNGDMWVVDTGEDIQPGDALISSDTPGHGMKDSDRFEVSYVVARAAEPVRWSEVTEMVNGVKHKRISILFDSQVREKTAVLAAEVAALRKQLAAQTAELEQAKQVLAQLAKQLSLRRAQQ